MINTIALKTLRPHIYILLLHTLLASSYLQAQSPIWRNWYFGNHAALTWCNVPQNAEPIPIMTSDMYAVEGSASISDYNCNLLFYTDGVKVWGADNNIMSNTHYTSSGGELAGCYSSGQACMIIPKPGNTSLFYIITVDCVENNYANGMRYSVVDMNLNGGLGDVNLSEKNVPLLDSANEALSAIYKESNGAIWVIAHKNNTIDYYAFLITANGIELNTPVISSIGYNTSVFKTKLSRNCTKLATIGQGWFAGVEIMRFDKTTGMLSDNVVFSHSIRRGLEFSPNGKLLYLSTFTSLHQYDVTVFDSAHIANSEVLLDSNQTLGCDLQLGPDKKIYHAQVNSIYLNRINQPNEPGLACSFVSDDVLLGTTVNNANKSYFGLPNIIVPACEEGNEPIDLGPDAIICEGDSVILDATDQWENYIWTTGDTSQWIKVTQSGSYGVTVDNCCFDHEGSITVTVLPAPTVTFDSDSITSTLYSPLLLSPTITGAFSYLWSTGETTSEISVSQAGNYTITVSGNNGCSVESSITVIEGVGIGKIEDSNHLVVYPNPSSSSFYVKLNDAAAGTSRIEIYNIEGQLIISTNVTQATTHFDTAQLQKGIYFVNVKSEVMQTVKQIVIL